ncbi:glycine cleavage system aminomethyltransferase GcvT [Desulforamulus aquiferis]|uniref:Aminomethyltransferase n=1 Tax=Desulforamulus aquiferis TaxID=1397668 RepID=A0AAW7ZFZ8_9FIRM|nr:glycine cleavage system aminomethyltransferase GcvT [Desulforamulus aquiferis]MDO7787956.1 glycine cleavage system aminomethyltransferase GcvT [Desulforamulus aquiferis]
MSQFKRTPLYDIHLSSGAKMVEFGNWQMPIQYEGIIKEHQAVRSAAGLFDVSHMGEIEVEGQGAKELLQRLITNDINRLSPGKALYSPMCNQQGGTVDDLLIYMIGQEKYLLVVNAANIDKDYNWVVNQAGENTLVHNVSDNTCQLALQGPTAQSILQKLTMVELREIKYFNFVYGDVLGCNCLISRTGYTGEDGFELYFPSEFGEKIWLGLMSAGEPEGIKPIGLGARDTLRFEACLALYGHELTDDISPLMAGLGWTVKFNKGEFIGRDSLWKESQGGTEYRLVSLEMLERGIPRQNYSVTKEGNRVGWVTSGTFAPTLGKNLALAYVKSKWAENENILEVLIRDKPVKAVVVPKPFYKREG